MSATERSEVQRAATPRRLIGGVCARVAGSTGIPVTFVRLGWIALALVLAAAEPVAAWIAVAPYLIAWFLVARAGGSRAAAEVSARAQEAAQQASQDLRGAAERIRQRAAERTAPQAVPAARAAAARPVAATRPEAANREPLSAEPAAPGAGADDPLAARPYLRDFVRYLWTPETTPRPLYKTWAHGFVLSDLDVPKEKMTRTTMLPRMPYGRIVLWPGWLVFITESHNQPGKVPSGAKFFSVVFDYWREMRRFASMFRLLKAAHGQLTQEQRDLFERALVNGNSIIVPLSTVRKFHQERFMLTPRLLVQTSDGRELMFGPNGYLEVATSFWRLTTGFFGAWHPKLQRALREAADNNKES